MSKQKTPIWETVAIFGAIFSLWPAVLRYWAAYSKDVDYADLPLGRTVDWSHDFWSYLMYAALAVMVAVAVKRVRRVAAMGKKSDSNDDFEV